MRGDGGADACRAGGDPRRRRSPSRRSSERERTTDHDVAAFVDVLSASAGPAGRWIHYGLTSSDVLDTALALQLQAARREIVVPGALRLLRARSPRGRASTTTRSASGARTACTPSRPRSGSSSPASRSRRTATPLRLERAFAQASVGAISGAVGTYAATSDRTFERQRARASSGCAREPVSTQVVRARPPRRAAAGDRAGRRGAGALRHRDPPPAAHRGARGRGAVPHGPEGLQRDAAQAQPDHRPSSITGLARVLRGNAQRGRRERRAVARARHLALVGRARDPARLDDRCSTTCMARADAVASGMVVHADRMRANLDATPARCSASGCCSRSSSRPAWRATTPTGSSRTRPGGVGRGHAAARSAVEPAARDPGLDLDAIFD